MLRGKHSFKLNYDFIGFLGAIKMLFSILACIAHNIFNNFYCKTKRRTQHLRRSLHLRHGREQLYKYKQKGMRSPHPLPLFVYLEQPVYYKPPDCKVFILRLRQAPLSHLTWNHILTLCSLFLRQICPRNCLCLSCLHYTYLLPALTPRENHRPSIKILHRTRFF